MVPFSRVSRRALGKFCWRCPVSPYPLNLVDEDSPLPKGPNRTKHTIRQLPRRNFFTMAPHIYYALDQTSVKTKEMKSAQSAPR